MAAEISYKNIKRHDVQKIGMAYINHLVEKGDYDSAARSVLCLPQVEILIDPSYPQALLLDVLFQVMGQMTFVVVFPPKCRKCQKVLGKNMELWENEVYRFKTIGQLKVSL